MIKSNQIATSLNYRAAVSVRSDFFDISTFPEVWHAHGITSPPFSGGERAGTGQGINTIYRRKTSLLSGTYCVSALLRAGWVREIRNQGFSDLWRRSERLLHNTHKNQIIIVIFGLVYAEQ